MQHTPLFDAFVAPARPRRQLWRLLLGVGLILGIALLWLAVMFGVLSALSGVETSLDWFARLVDPTSPTSTLLLLVTFVGMALGPMVAVKLLHQRDALTLFGPRARALRGFFTAVITVAVVYGGALALWSLSYDAVPNLSWRLWLSFLPAALVGILIQTTAEELVFRGYLQQQLAARFASPLVWMLLPSLCFGMLHFDPATAGDTAWAIVASTTAFGLIAADLTRVSGSLGAACGLHFANNVIAILILATKGTITGLALSVTPYEASDLATIAPLMLGDLVMLLAVWLILRQLVGP